MKNEFTEYEYELLTKCWDEKSDYAVNIDRDSKMVAIISKKNNRIIRRLGTNYEELFEKVLRLAELEPSTLKTPNIDKLYNIKNKNTELIQYI